MDAIQPAMVEKAVGALKAFLAGELKPQADAAATKKKGQELFDREEYFNLVFTLRRVPQKDSLKPIRVPIPHSLYGREGASVCFISKDPQREYEDFAAKNPVKNLREVVSVGKLRTDFKQYQHRRELMARHNLFVCDARVVPLLPPLLGSKFFAAKKQPYPIDVAEGSFRAKVAEARDSTYMYISMGTALNVKVAHSEFDKAAIVANVMAAIPAIVERIPQKWRNVKAIALKTDNSLALPLYNSASTVENLALTPEEEAVNAANAAKGELHRMRKVAAKLNMTLGAYKAYEARATPRGLTVEQYRLLRRARYALSEEGRADSGALSVAKAEKIVEQLTVKNPKYIAAGDKKENADKSDDEAAEAEEEAEESEEEEEEVVQPKKKAVVAAAAGKKAAAVKVEAEAEAELPKPAAAKKAAVGKKAVAAKAEPAPAAAEEPKPKAKRTAVKAEAEEPAAPAKKGKVTRK